MRPNDPQPQMSGDPSDPPPGGGASGASGPGSPEDPLDALRDRVRSTQDAVERLADEAAQAAREATGAGPEAGAGGSAGGRPRPGGAVRRIRRAWSALGGDQRLVAVAALRLFVCLFFPWYSTSPTHVPAHQHGVSTSHGGLATFGWVEAAVLLVALGVLWLLFARAERRAFHLPGGDGGVILAAGVWVAFLILWRFFDRPGFGSGVAVGLPCGTFLTLPVARLPASAGPGPRSAPRPAPPLRRAAE